MVTQVPSGELTPVERSLVEHVCAGEGLDLTANDEVIDEAGMRSWGDSRTCRASVIRDILCGRLAADPDPHGLRLRGSRIAGRLDLENLATDLHLELTDCFLEEGVLARDARLASIALDGCHIEHATESPLDAVGLTCGRFTMAGARITGHTTASAVNLRGAHIAGSLDCDGAIMHNHTGPALEAGRLQVTQDVYLRSGFTAAGAGDDAAISLRGAHIGGNLECDDAVLRSDSSPALDADGVRVDQNVYLRGGFTATGAGDDGSVVLRGAHIGGQLSCIGAKLINDSGPALDADWVQVSQNVHLRGFTATGAGSYGTVNLRGARIDGNLECDGAVLRNDSGAALKTDAMQVGQHLFLRGGFTAAGAGDDGAVNLIGTHIGANLECTGAQLRNDSGPAVQADNLQLDQDLFLTGGFTAVGAGDDGSVVLRGAHIGGQLSCIGAKLINDSGPALGADGVQVSQSVYLGGFTATGAGDHGAVNLRGARIDGNLECDGAVLRNDSGPAMHADNLYLSQDMLLNGGFTAIGSGEDGAVRLSGARIGGNLGCYGAMLRNESGPGLRAFRLQVDGDMYLTGGFTATGSRDRGAVRLTSARIGGSLDCSGAELRNDSGPALLAYGMQVGQDIYLTRKFTAISGGKREVINLRTTRVGGAFDFEPQRLEHTDDSCKRLRVDGLTYTGVPGPDSGSASKSGNRWRELLRYGTPAYTAQPYQQLAAGYRALGDDHQARQTLIAQRNDQLARTDTGRWERLWGRITQLTLGYGYQPWRALLFLAAVIVVSCVLAVMFGAHGALAQTGKTVTPGRSCTVVQQLSVGLDLNLPVGTSVARVDCDLTSDSASVTAAWLSAVSWVFRVLAWVFAALFIAGFTSAVRKT